MKSKCSFILKALTALVLAVVMLFGTVATTLAATVDTADTSANVDLADTGYNNYCIVGDFFGGWESRSGDFHSRGSYSYYDFTDRLGETDAKRVGYLNYFEDGSHFGPGSTQDKTGSAISSEWSYGCNNSNSGNSIKVKVYNGVFRFKVAGGDNSTWSNIYITDLSPEYKLYHDGSTEIGTFVSNGDGSYTLTTSANLSAATEYSLSVKMTTGGVNTLHTDNSLELTSASPSGTIYRYGDNTSGNKFSFTTTKATKYRFNFTPTATTTGNDSFSVDYPYTLTLNTQGHGGANSEIYALPGSAFTQPANPTQAGYTFGGWYTDNTFTTTYNWSTTATGDNTVYAKWTENYTTTSVSVSTGNGTIYAGSDDTGSAALASYNVGVDTTQTLYAKDGATYNFVGWYATGSAHFTAGATEYTSATTAANNTVNSRTITIKGSGSTSTGAVIAVYVPASITITTGTKLQTTSGGAFNVDDGTAGDVTPSRGSNTFDYEETVDLVAVSQDAGIYHFIGWAKDSSDDIISPLSTYTITATEAASYHALFKQGGNVTFYDTNTDGTQGSAIAVSGNTTNFYYTGNYATPPADPSITGYNFLGWSTSLGGPVVNVAETAITEDTTFYAKYAIYTYSVTYTALGMDNATGGYAVSLAAPTADEDNGTGAEGTMDYGDSLALTQNNTNAAYHFVGWHIVNDSNPAAAATLPANTTFSDTSPLVLNGADDSKYHVYALYKKIYTMTLYNSYITENNAFIFRTAPPRKVTLTAAGSNAVTEYEYDGSAPRGHDVSITSGTKYGEGNSIRILAGDQVQLHYGALSGSDVICAVFYNNTGHYSTEYEDDIEFDHVAKSYSATEGAVGVTPDNGSRCLFANPIYYVDATQTLIRSQEYAATVNNTTHNVTFTAASDYLNVELELAEKKRIFFSDTDKITVNSVHVSNYYDIGEELTNGGTFATALAVKAKGSTSQLNNITLANIEVYYADENGKPYGNALDWDAATLINKGISSGTVISSTDGADSDEYIYFYSSAGGTGMPASNLYIDLKVTLSYSIKLDSNLRSDDIAKYAKFGRVANVKIQSTAGTDILTQNEDSLDAQGSHVVDDGGSVRLHYDFTGDFANYYMFIGWYKGNATSPDFDEGLISTDNDISFKPDKSVTVWAVGTRNLYINGSKWITGADSDWGVDPNHTGDDKYNYYQNQKMSYDEKNMVYYWTITPEMFNSISPDNTENRYLRSNSHYHSNDDKHEYWTDNNSVGNSYFMLVDVATGIDDNKKAVWSQITSFVFNDEDNGTVYGKVYPQHDNDPQYNYKVKNGYGFIDFAYSETSGFTAPITIYYNPSGNGSEGQQNKLYVKATPIYGHVYASNGYTKIDSYSDTGEHDKQDTTGACNAADTGVDVTVQPVYNDSVVTDDDDPNYFDVTLNGDGWNPFNTSDDVKTLYEGHVNDYTVKKRNGTVRITKTLSSATYTVSYFNVYNTATDKVTAVKATAGENNTYYIDLTMNENQGFYVVPIIEYNAYKDDEHQTNPEAMTVLFDSEQLKSKEWGDFVACYAWYTDNTPAYGDYPGQMMVPSDDGKSWSATFPSTKPGSNGATVLAGITFTNYFDSKRTWLGETNVYSGDSQIISGKYNSIATGSADVNYSNENFKAQTYDYREPIAFFKNKSDQDKLTIKFGIKSGGADLIRWTHTDLVRNNILHYKDDHPTWVDIEFEYLYDSTGRNFCDLGGRTIEGEPAPSFYICAKGEVAYNTNNGMKRVFWSGKAYQTPDSSANEPEGESAKGGYGTEVVYSDYKNAIPNEIDMSHAVQWYIYDAEGNYITNILSAAFADKAPNDDPEVPDQTKIAKVLKSLGYAVDNRSVMIAYDMPRYCYSESGGIANTGSTFDAYRFSGQWYQKNNIEKLYLNAEVGMITPDNGYEFAKSDTAGYGSVSVSLDVSSFAYPASEFSNVTGKASCFTTIADKDKKGVTFNASATNFVGWYYKDADGKMQKLDYSSPTGFSPSYSDDTTYYAMYKASAFYRYLYRGREKDVSYTITAGDLTAAEMAAGNMLSTDRSDTLTITNVPSGSIITRFKKTIDFSDSTTKSALKEYTLDISGANWTNATFNVTAYFMDGGESKAHNYNGIAYNTALDLTYRESHAVTDNAPANTHFVGWYDEAEDGNLISAQPNFGMVVVKDMIIYAHYAANDYSGTDKWKVYIDENEVTHEMYNNENSGMYYNDTIVHVRKDCAAETPLPAGAEVGILVLNDGGSNLSLNVKTTKLAEFADALGNGVTGRIGTTGRTVTKVVAGSDNVTSFGRADLAVRGDYASTVGTKYKVYAYVKIGGTYYFSAPTDTITYAAFNA